MLVVLFSTLSSSSSPQPVTLTALSHVVTVTVVSTVEAADIKMKIR